MKYDIKAKPVWIFKSQQEALTAAWLQELKIAYLYEPETYQTKIGKYTPDFYLPEINTYIEVKPKIKDFVNTSYKNLLKQFAIEKKADLFILAPKEVLYFEMNPDGLENVDDEGYIIKCQKCGHTSFTSRMGIYYCRKCKNHDGDHDIQETIIESFSGDIK